MKLNLYLISGSIQSIEFKLNKSKQNEKKVIENLKNYIKYIKEIPGVIDLIKSYEKIKNNDIFYPEESKIISKKEDFQFIYNELCKKLNKTKVVLNQKFNILKDGKSAKQFHKKCDNIGPNLTIIKTKENIIFGGFTMKNWKSGEKCKKDDLAFIFNLQNKKIYNIKKGENAIKGTEDQLVNFWNGKNNGYSSLVVTDECKNNNTCIKNDSSYEGMISDYEINGGKFNFQVLEMELYEIY